MTDGTQAPAAADALACAGAEIAALLRLADGTPGGQDDGHARAARLAAVALGCAEAFLGAAPIVRGYEDVVAADGRWRRLAAVPVRGIAGVTSLPADGAPAILPVEDYRIDIAADGAGWVRVTNGGPLAAVSYTAGLAPDWAGLPAPVAEGVVMLGARLFTDAPATSAPPPEIAALWRPFRRLRLAGDVPEDRR